MKRILSLIIVGILSIGMVTGCGCQNKKENEKEEEEKVVANTKEDVVKDQELEVFKFTNTSLIYENGNSKLQTTVTNTSNEKAYLAEFLIHVKDENGNEIVTMRGFVGDSIDANSSKIINSTYGDDLTKAASIEYEIVR